MWTSSSWTRGMHSTPLNAFSVSCSPALLTPDTGQPPWEPAALCAGGEGMHSGLDFWICDFFSHNSDELFMGRSWAQAGGVVGLPLTSAPAARLRCARAGCVPRAPCAAPVWDVQPRGWSDPHCPLSLHLPSVFNVITPSIRTIPNTQSVHLTHVLQKKNSRCQHIGLFPHKYCPCRHTNTQ